MYVNMYTYMHLYTYISKEIHIRIKKSLCINIYTYI